MATRPTFIPKFEEAESIIRSRITGRLGEEWRKEPGDFMYDAVATDPPEIKQLEASQDFILQNAFAQYAEGDYLDAKLAEVGLSRKQATPNKRSLTITAETGVIIPKGYTLSQVILDSNGNPLQYTTDPFTSFIATGALTLTVTCTTAGRIGNIPTGSPLMLQPTIPGIQSIVDTGTVIPGTDQESDADVWDRYSFKVNNPDTGGNKYDYTRWAQEVTGVGKVMILPIWNGGGTVKILVADTEGQPASSLLIAEVQEYIDPNSEGLGEGKAPCGAAVTVMAATNKLIDITATVTYDSTADPNIVKGNFQAALVAYLKELIFSESPVAYVKVGALLINTQGVANYTNLLVNTAATDVVIGADEVATLGTVTI